MLTGLEILVLVGVLVAVVIAAQLVQTLLPLLLNTIAGLLIFVIAHLAVGFSVAVTPLVILIVAIGGIPGSLLVLLLAVLEIAFVG